MLGTGTQADPYQVTTIAEFRSMNSISAHYKLMNDLDVNGSEWESGWGNVTLSYADFNGNGHQIRNFICSGRFLTINDNAGIFHDCDILNVVIQSANCIVTNSSNSNGFPFAKFTNCKFGVVGDNYAVQFKNTTFDRCSITMRGGFGTPFYECVLEKTAVNFEDCLWFGSSALLHCRAGYGVVKNSYFTGKISLGTNVGDISLICGTSSGNTQCRNVYVAIELNKNGYVMSASAKLFWYPPSSLCFYDHDLLGTTLISQGNVCALTTAQCKDKDYLNSIGFVVV